MALEAGVVLASAEGDREVPIADYFTGYRETVRRADELIRAVRIPMPTAGITAFHKIAKRRYDDISSVAVGFAIELAEGSVKSARIGLGGVAATPVRALATEAALEGRPWSAETVREAAGVLARRGHPDGRPPGQRGVPLGDAGHRAAASSGPSEVRDRSEHSCPSGPPTPSSAWRSRTRAPRCTSPAPRSTPTTWSAATRDCLHAWPVQAPHAHARVTDLRVERGVRRARRGPGADRRRRARASTTPA